MARMNTWQGSFPPTMWTLIEEAQGGDKEAITWFCCRYWRPAFCYLLRLESNHAIAEELTQDLFCKLVTGDPLADLLPRVYRFRSYLKRAALNIWIDFIRREFAQKRYPEEGLAYLDDVLARVGDLAMPADEATPGDLFDGEYAYELLDVTIERVQDECESDGLEDHFGMFALRFLTDSPAKWDEIGVLFSVSGDTARNHAATVRKRFGKILFAEVRKGCSTDPDALDEIRDLIRVIRLLRRRLRRRRQDDDSDSRMP